MTLDPMTLSFGQLVDQPGGTLVYTTVDGSITFDNRLAGPYLQPVWGYSEETLDLILNCHRRERFQAYFPGWWERKNSQRQSGFHNVNSQITPTEPLGLLLNRIYIYVNGIGIQSDFYAGDCVFVEMLIEGRVEFVRLNAFNFFRKMAVIDAFGKYDHEKQNKTEAEKLMIDMNDYELFRSSRLVLQ